MKNKQTLKETYNKTLQRYYNGCNYIAEHLEEVDKYLPVVKILLNRLNWIICQMESVTEKEILEGFEIE